MANIKVVVDYELIDGTPLTFQAPCNASDVTGLVVYHPINGVQTSTEFRFKDAHGSNIGNINELFAAGAYVKVILDTINNRAFIQNADTNAYLEGRLNGIINMGSYTGTGTYGSSNPNTLTFQKPPKVVFIKNTTNVRSVIIFINGCTLYNYEGGDVPVAWNGNSISWYHETSNIIQYNEKNKVYNWVALF